MKATIIKLQSFIHSCMPAIGTGKKSSISEDMSGVIGTTYMRESKVITDDIQGRGSEEIHADKLATIVIGSAQREVVGLHNLGNTCYFNSVLQVLGALKPFRDIFFHDDVSYFRERSMPLSTSLQNYFSDTSIWEKDSTDRGSVGENKRKRGNRARGKCQLVRDTYCPKAIFDAICENYPEFDLGDQEDSLEVLKCLFECLRAEAIGCEGPVSIERRLDDIFGVELSNITKCEACDHVSNEVETNMSISLPVWMLNSGRGSIADGISGRKLHGGGGGNSKDWGFEISGFKFQFFNTAAQLSGSAGVSGQQLSSSSKEFETFQRLIESEEWKSLDDAPVEGEVIVRDSSAQYRGCPVSKSQARSPTSSRGESRSVNTVEEPTVKNAEIRVRAANSPTSPAGGSESVEEHQTVIFPPEILPPLSKDQPRDTRHYAVSPVKPARSQSRVTLEECLRQHTKPEEFSGENAWQCTGCTELVREEMKRKCTIRNIRTNGMVGATGKEMQGSEGTFPENVDVDSWWPPVLSEMTIKRTLFSKLPHVLILHLNRFEEDEFRPGKLQKINGHVKFEETLDMQPFLTKK